MSAFIPGPNPLPGGRSNGDGLRGIYWEHGDDGAVPDYGPSEKQERGGRERWDRERKERETVDREKRDRDGQT
jgi:hypothetical protein